MNTLRTTITIALFSFSTLSFGQDAHLYFSLQQLPDLSWGVFVKPSDIIFPSERTSAGTGQVTIVAPIGFEYAFLENHGGTWIENARVESPQEANDKVYISFGFINDNPKIQLSPNEETLLFTFMADAAFSNTFSLFENDNDPFSTPNSMGNNPGNEIGMLDFGTGTGMQTYRYAGNYKSDKLSAMAVFMSDDEGDSK